ncbi:MAG: tetratricopeptide repeat protein [Ignavibacteria bacterium]|nr:tetratricopeptide repeat protein [Ignavibacteria bacterium]
MTNEQAQDLINSAENDNIRGKYVEAEVHAQEVISHFRSAASGNDDFRKVYLSRALCQLSFTQRRRGLGDAQLALASAQEAHALALEVHSTIDIAHALAAIAGSYQYLREYTTAPTYYDQALNLYQELGQRLEVAKMVHYQGALHFTLGDYTAALQCMTEALPVIEEFNDKNLLAHLTTDLARIYIAIGSAETAHEYNLRSLSYYEELGNARMVAGSIANCGTSYFINGKYSEALEYIQRAISILDQLGEKEFRAICTLNIGTINFRIHDYTLAMVYFKQALSIYEDLGADDGIATVLGGIGETYAKEEYEDYNPEKAEEFLLRSIAIKEKLGIKITSGQHFALTEIYQKQQRWEEAFVYLKQCYHLEKEAQSIELKNQANTLANSRKSAELEKNLAIERALAQSTEALLHKTLPKSIADRVIRGESRIADHFDSVSVLFADVVGFTKISASMPPKAVLDFMNFIFEHFDTIAAKYGCERIKTIGDGYMAICGAPVPYDNHAERLASMALAMMEDITLPQEVRDYLPKGTVFHLRIGLHSGEITAGLIGTGKLAYDIYGDTVNTASRMESHGEPGKIHVSEEFLKKLLMVNGELLMYKADDFSSLTINHLPLTIISRGEIDIKGKGKLKTYFLKYNIESNDL